jgi:16S rRNA (cytidine1402-2'-O)-methyltransferase
VIPIPGANAALSALVASGLPTDEFQFIGFLPEKAGARRSRLEALADEARKQEGARTLIFYEAPHRILETLADLEAVWGPALRVVVARELTKIHEEFLRGTVAEARRELGARERVRGEITLLIEAPGRVGGLGASDVQEKIAVRVARIQTESGVDEKEALKRLARELGASKSDLYRELCEAFPIVYALVDERNNSFSMGTAAPKFGISSDVPREVRPGCEEIGSDRSSFISGNSASC